MNDAGNQHYTFLLKFKAEFSIIGCSLIGHEFGTHFAGVLPKYFNSEWSVAQFRLVEGSQYIVAFGHQKNTVVILGLDGRCVQ